MAVNPNAPAASDAQIPPPAADAPASPVGSEGASAPAAANDAEKAFRDLKAEIGRERAARQRIEGLAAQQAARLEEMQGTYSEAARFIAEQRRRGEEAQLATLPPEQRIARRVELAIDRKLGQQGQNGAQQARIAAPQPSADEMAAYKERRSREILDEIGAEFGVNLAPDDPDLVDDSEAEFRASARVIARARGKQARQPQGEAGVARKNESESDIEARVTAKVMQELGVGKSNSAKASGGGGAVTDVDVAKAVDQTRGMTKAAREKHMRDLRDRAHDQVDWGKLQ